MSGYGMSRDLATERSPGWGTAAAVGYSAVWVAGLVVWSSGLPVTASAGQVTEAYRGHGAVAAVQSTLVHGLAALALAVVVRMLVAAMGRAGAPRVARTVAASGFGAVAVSVLQWLLGCLLATWAVPAGRTGVAGDLYDGVNLLDGVKMAALAVLVTAASAAAIRDHALPRWLAYLGAVLAVALVVSAVGYLFGSAALAAAAYVSLPLLLIWVTGAGLVLARRR